jgi:hypothetical protein
MELRKTGIVIMFTIYPVFSISRVNNIKPAIIAVSALLDSTKTYGRSYWTNKPSVIYTCLFNI